MAITGISAISGQQIIAAGAVSAKTAATAEYTTGGGSIQGLYNTVNTNSASWDSDPAVFPANIDTGNNTIAVVTTGFQDNKATRPTLFISGTTATSNYPRMLLSENHAATQTSKSGAFLADAFEFYTGKNGGSQKVLRIDSTGMSSNVGFLFNKAHYDMWNKYSAESGNYYTTGNPSGFITGVDLTPYQTTADMTAYQEAGNYMSANALDSLSSNWETVTDKLDITAFSDVSGGFLTTAEATNFYTTANESGFITGVDLTPYQTTAGMTAYQPAGDYLTTADSSEFYTTGNESGFITGVPAGTMNESEFDYDANDKIYGYNGSAFAGGSEVPEGVMVESGLEYNAVNGISAYNGSAIAQYGAEKQWLVVDDTLLTLSNSAQFALGVNISAIAQLLGVDETVLQDNIVFSATKFTLSEPAGNFDRLRLYDSYGTIVEVSGNNNRISWTFDRTNSNGTRMNRCYTITSNNGIDWNEVNVYGWNQTAYTGALSLNGGTNWYLETTKIVGIGRKN